MRRTILIAVLVLGLAVALLSLGTSSGTQDQPECTVTVQPGESIQKAIYKAEAAERGMVCLTEGSWRENLVIEKSLTLRGAGPGKSIISVDHDRPVVLIISDEEIEVTIEGLSITGAGFYGECSPTIPGVSVALLYCSHGLSLGGKVKATIQGNTISKSRDGIYMEGSAKAIIRENSIRENAGNGIFTEDTAWAIIEGNTILRNQVGIEIRYKGESEITIIENTISENAVQGIFIMSGSAQATIEGNTISRNGDVGILMWGSQVTIKGNTIEGNKSDGIFMSGSAKVAIIDSIIRNNTGWGIAVSLMKCGYSEAIGRFTGEVIFEGNNQIYDNGEGDVCLSSSITLPTPPGSAQSPPVSTAPIPITASDRLREIIARFRLKEKDTIAIINQDKYVIATLSQRIDPETLEPLLGTGETVVYLDLEGRPIFDTATAQRVGVIETAREKARGLDLEKAIADLERLKSEFRNLGDEEIVFSAYNWALTIGTDVAKVTKEIRVISEVERLGQALSTIEKIKDLAKTQPTGILVKLITFALRKLIADPIREARADLDRYLTEAIQGYRSAWGITSKGELKDYEAARTFLSALYRGKASEDAARYLFKVIFENWARGAWMVVGPSVGMATFGLSNFVAIVKEAADQLNWTIDILYQHTLSTCKAQAELIYALTEAGDYALALSGNSSGAKEYKLKYLKAIQECDAQAAKIPQAVVDYWRGFDPRRFFSFLKRITLFSPAELRVYDSEGRVTGMVRGAIKEEISDSLYDSAAKTAVIFSPSSGYYYEVFGIDEGTYGLEITDIADDGTVSFTAKEIPISSGVAHRYTVDRAALARGEEGVVLQIDSDGDGVFEKSLRSGPVMQGITSPASGAPRTKAVWMWVVVGVIALIVVIATLVIRFGASPR
jgi:parallel beta-helix repeat protein